MSIWQAILRLFGAKPKQEADAPESDLDRQAAQQARQAEAERRVMALFDRYREDELAFAQAKADGEPKGKLEILHRAAQRSKQEYEAGRRSLQRQWAQEDLQRHEDELRREVEELTGKPVDETTDAAREAHAAKAELSRRMEQAELEKELRAENDSLNDQYGLEDEDESEADLGLPDADRDEFAAPVSDKEDQQDTDTTDKPTEGMPE